MSTAPISVESPARAPSPATPKDDQKTLGGRSSGWQRYLTPIFVLLLALAVLVTVSSSWNSWEGAKTEQVTDDAYVRGDVTPLGTKVAGIVSVVLVSDYQQVHKGDLLVQLQDDDYQAQVAQATAGVAAGKAGIENNRRQRLLQQAKIDRAQAAVSEAQAEISAAQAGIAATQADLDRTLAERRRQEALLETNSTTHQKVDQAVAAEQVSEAQLASRQASLEASKAALSSAQSAVQAERRGLDVLNSQELQLIADLQAKQAALAVAQVNLGYTKIEAPADGSVGERQVRPGQLVAPGTQVIPFVERVRWVQANYKETQLTNVKVGDPAQIRIDEYPSQVIHGKVIEIAPASGSQFSLLPPDNATGNYTKVVQRIPVKIALEDTELVSKLRPGLSVIATVRTKQ